MKSEAIATVYNKVYDLTTAGFLKWRRVEENTFRVSFSRSTLDIQADHNYDPALHHLDIRNEDGVIIAYIAKEEVSEPEYGDEGLIWVKRDAEPLFRAVEAQVYKTEATANSLIVELQNIENAQKSRHSWRVEDLSDAEVQDLFEPLAGSGGFQSLLKKLREQCDPETRTIKLDADDLRRIPEYAFDAGQGGFQKRLLKVFGRVLGPKLGR